MPEWHRRVRDFYRDSWRADGVSLLFINALFINALFISRSVGYCRLLRSAAGRHDLLPSNADYTHKLFINYAHWIRRNCRYNNWKKITNKHITITNSIVKKKQKKKEKIRRKTSRSRNRSNMSTTAGARAGAIETGEAGGAGGALGGAGVTTNKSRRSRRSIRRSRSNKSRRSRMRSSHRSRRSRRSGTCNSITQALLSLNAWNQSRNEQYTKSSSSVFPRYVIS